MERQHLDNQKSLGTDASTASERVSFLGPSCCVQEICVQGWLGELTNWIQREQSLCNQWYYGEP
jgi:hypothetical protein